MGNKKKKKCSTSSYIGSLTNCENIFQYNKKTFFMSPRETSDPYLDELLNRRSELVLKCKHQNQFLLKNFSSNDWSFEPYDNLRKYNINDIPNGFILLAFSAWVIIIIIISIYFCHKKFIKKVTNCNWQINT